jgi:hypothetical protein
MRLDKYILVDNDIPYINWRKVYRDLRKAGTKPTESLFTRLIKEWLPKLEAAIDQPSVLMESGTVLYFTHYPKQVASERLVIVHGVRDRIKEIFGDIVPKSYIGKALIVELEKLDAYYRYISHFYPESKDPDRVETYGRSGGCMCNDGYLQVVLNDNAKLGLSRIVAHETSHIYLAYYGPPRWLNEGIATNAEGMFTSGRPWYTRDDENRGTIKKWNQELFDQFLSGEIIHNYRAQHAFYSLSYMVVHAMIQDRVDFPKLLLRIRARVDPQEAVRKVTGKDIIEYVPPRERSQIEGKR